MGRSGDYRHAHDAAGTPAETAHNESMTPHLTPRIAAIPDRAFYCFTAADPNPDPNENSPDGSALLHAAPIRLTDLSARMAIPGSAQLHWLASTSRSLP